TFVNPPDFLPYASHYISMLIGRNLIKDLNIKFREISHQNFNIIIERFENNQSNYHTEAREYIEQALKDLYGDREISLQQLSATFRRGDLLESLHSMDLLNELLEESF
ncbi:MAG: hypothetical protein ABTQ25_07555, partial [Nitrosomonas ureae]